MSLDAGTYWPVELSYRDAGNEIGRMSFYGLPITVSDDAGDIEEAETAWEAFETAADAITLGAKVKSRYYSEITYMTTQPTNGAARETKLLIQYQDTTTGKQFTATLPTIDPTIPSYIVNKNVKDAISLSTPTGITNFITAFQNLARAPETHNAVAVVGLKVVGRNI